MHYNLRSFETAPCKLYVSNYTQRFIQGVFDIGVPEFNLK